MTLASASSGWSRQYAQPSSVASANARHSSGLRCAFRAVVYTPSSGNPNPFFCMEKTVSSSGSTPDWTMVSYSLYSMAAQASAPPSRKRFTE